MRAERGLLKRRHRGWKENTLGTVGREERWENGEGNTSVSETVFNMVSYWQCGSLFYCLWRQREKFSRSLYLVSTCVPSQVKILQTDFRSSCTYCVYQKHKSHTSDSPTAIHPPTSSSSTYLAIHLSRHSLSQLLLRINHVLAEDIISRIFNKSCIWGMMIEWPEHSEHPC